MPRPTPSAPPTDSQKAASSLSWLNFFLADIQTGVGPFLAAYLAASHWNPRSVGIALTSSGLITVAISPFAGGIVDASHNKRRLIALATFSLSLGAACIALSARHAFIAAALVLLGAAGAFLGPALAAITLGIVGPLGFDRQFGRNQSFSAAGNVITALALAAVSWFIGMRSIFIVAAALAIPVWLVLRHIRPQAIDNDVARGDPSNTREPGGLRHLLNLAADRTLLIFFACAFLFHFSNAAMLPLLGEMLAKGNARAAAPFMSACIIVTQCVIAVSAATFGRLAGTVGRKPLLLLGFGALPIRGILYAVTHLTGALIAIQLLDGLANSIFGVVSILLVADRMRGKGHFNLAQGALAACVGLGAAISNTYGGILAHRFGFRGSFLGLAAVALLALLLLWFGVPETLHRKAPLPTS
ncbi:MAG: MFS transporter [Acidobacteria bacterium]|nr:MFS transporter [Acidobacteriota bacterium]